MKSNNRWIHQQASPPIPHSPNFSYFTEEARRAGYVRDHQHHLQLHPQSRPSLPPYPQDMHEAIQREIEKDRIREEIIMSEVVRRRVLEAEVRRELMMEREMALRRGNDGLPFGGPPPVMGFNSQTRLMLLETEKLNVRRDNGFETLPFQRGTAELRVSEVKPIPEGGKEKKKIILLAKPDGSISGSKRKAVTPPPSASEIPSDDIILTKKAKEEWSCALCQVSATCQRGLDEHLQGKKHKSKEAALKAQKAGKNYSIGLFPKKTDKSVTTIDPGTEDDESVASKKSEQGENPNSEKNQSNGDVNKKKKNRFWCEMCQVGAHSMKVMNAHKKGKKHVSRLERTNRNNESGPHDQEKIEDGENKTPKDCDEAGSDHEPIETVEKKLEDHEAPDEAEPEDCEPLDGTELADREPVDETKPDVADELTVLEFSRLESQSTA